MVSIRDRLDRVKDDPALLIDHDVAARACLAAGHRGRKRCLDATATLTAFATQIAHDTTAVRESGRRLRPDGAGGREACQA